MNILLSWALKLGFLNKILRPLASVYGKVKGFRTQGLLALASLSYVAGFLGWYPADQSQELVNALLLMAIPTTADKIKGILDAISGAAKKLEGMQEQPK